MKLRQLTKQGIAKFEGYVTTLREQPKMPIPTELLTQPGDSEALPTSSEVEAIIFATRLDAAAYLYAVLTQSGLKYIEHNTGLWTWLTLFYFDQLCPADGNGHRKPGEPARYFPRFTDARRYHRHLLFGPYAVYRLYHTDTEILPVLLSAAMTVARGMTYQLFVGNNELLVCRSAVSVANRLYYDPVGKKLKRGSGSDSPGGCRRLIDFLQQINVTYDLQSLSEETLISMLPKEFKTYL